jgi:hypothetical protein
MRNIYGPRKNLDGGWIIRTNEEKDSLVKNTDTCIVRYIKAQIRRWKDHTEEWIK